jgi:hypothetical protein
LGNALMPKEIELKALAQDGFIDLADPALPGSACVRDQDVQAAEFLPLLGRMRLY